MRRHLFNFFAAFSLLLCAGVCVLWVRGRTGSDTLAFTYDRYLPDQSAASSQIHFTSNQRLWLEVNWGSVGPPTGNLVWGYYINADESGGWPRIRFSHERYDAMWSFPGVAPDDSTVGRGPLRWLNWSRSQPWPGERFHIIRMGVTHWLAAPILLFMPMFWIKRFRTERRARFAGLCRKCHYDMRATPERCPECGTVAVKQMSVAAE